MATAKRITLTRVKEDKRGTIGYLSDGGKVLCVTLEEPWRDNQRQVSCVPKGVYKVVPHSGTRFKGVWRLKDVPHRDAILIHAGNTISDTEGCILVGQIETDTGIGQSQLALQFLRSYLPDTFELEIK